MPQGQPEAADVVVVSRLAEDDWRLLRDVRLAALTDAPEAFGTTLAQESGYPAGYWVTLVRTAGIFVATSDGAPVGLAAGVPRKPRRERGLAAMWVTPPWRTGRERGARDGSACGCPPTTPAPSGSTPGRDSGWPGAPGPSPAIPPGRCWRWSWISRRRGGGGTASDE
jgi:hypothetical protein